MQRPLDLPLERIALIGVGLMGGSLGMATSAAGLAKEVVGFDIDPSNAERALDRGAITSAGSSISDSVEGAEIVFIATPLSAIVDVYKEAASALQKGALVTDVGSSKARVVERISRMVGEGTHFIGGHPIAGSEAEGIDSATPDLFVGCHWILTPTSETSSDAYGGLVRFLNRLGVKVLSLEPARHDELVALTSHLPQVLASVLMGFASDISAAEGGLPLVGAGSFRDMTRVAASPPGLWVGILEENRRSVLDVLDRFEEALGRMKGQIADGDWEALRGSLDAARHARSELGAKAGQAPGSLSEVLIPVPDRPGVLAEVTTTIGELGLNIEDLDIVHSAEGGRGTIHLTMSASEAPAAAEALATLGYSPKISTTSL